MNKYWLNKRGNKQCILFFNGWGMDESIVNNLEFGNYDICMFYDYNPVTEIDLNTDLYEKVYIVAWSLGVWAASQSLVMSKIKYNKGIAINGTQVPKNELYGIPPQIFKATLNTWNDKNRDKFNRRALGGKEEFTRLKKLLLARTSYNQKDELYNINKDLESKPLYDIKFDCSIVGEKDLIFPSQNQINYWKNKSRLIKMDMPHYPFGSFKSWDAIIEI